MSSRLMREWTMSPPASFSCSAARVQAQVLARRTLPAAVEAHHAAAQLTPTRRAHGGHGAGHRSAERGGGRLVEAETGARVERRVAVDHRFDEPAGGAH